MLPDPPFKIVGTTNIKRTVSAFKNVDKELHSAFRSVELNDFVAEEGRRH